VGVFVNPTGGTCAVDPNNTVVNPEINNTCSNTVTVKGPSLSASKANNGSGMGTVGSPFTWTITVTNGAGTLAAAPNSLLAAANWASSVTVLTDDLPNPGLTYGSSVTVVTPPSTGSISCAIAGFVLTCAAGGSGATLNPGASLAISVTATPTSAAAGLPFTNSCVVAAPTNGVGTTCPSNTVNVPGAMLSAIKTNTTTGNQINLGASWTWTITVTDAQPGPFVAAAIFAPNATVLTDKLPNPGISYPSTVNVTTAPSTGSISCNISGFTLTCTAGSGGATLNPGASFALSFLATPSVTGAFTNGCVVSPPTNGPGTSCPPNTVVVQVPAGQLTIVKSFASDTLLPGTTNTDALTITIQNATLIPQPIAFTDTLPAPLTVSSLVSNNCPGTLTATPGTNVIELANATLASGATCNVTVDVTSPAGTPPTRVCNVVYLSPTGFPATACLTIGPTVIEPDAFTVTYAANLNIGDSIINLSNAGTQGGFVGAIPPTLGNVCANVYAFAPQENMVACCTCLVTPDGLNSLSVLNDLVANTLTPGPVTSLTVDLVATSPVNGACNAGSTTNVGFQTLASGLTVWGTTFEPTSLSVFGTVPVKGQSERLSISELNALTSTCGFLQQDGSGFGVCNSCRVGALTGGKN
jgi:hypothetical protein